MKTDAAKVGLFVLIGAVVAAYFLLRIENVELRGNRRSYLVQLANAQGLIEKSPVLLKGVKVGRVIHLELRDDHVIAKLSLAPDVVLREGTRATVASIGLLGEKELELIPGPTTGSPLTPDTLIPSHPTPTLDSAISTIGHVGEDVKAVTASVRDSLSDDRLQRLVDELTQLTSQTRELIATNQAEAHAALVSVRKMADSITVIAGQLGGATGAPPKGGESSGVGGSGAPSATEHLAMAAANLDEISSRVNRGEGALGKLVQDEQTQEKLSHTLDAVDNSATTVSDGLDALRQTRFRLEVRTDYLFRENQPKGFLTFDVRPPARWFLRVGGASQPLGLRTERRVVTTVPDETGTPQSVVALQAEQTDGVGFSLQGGYRLGPAQLRAGLIESRAGLGADLLLWKDRLRLTADGWDFGHETWRPHLRFEGSLAPVSWGELIAGWDDPLNRNQELDSVFFGVGLRLQTGQ